MALAADGDFVVVWERGDGAFPSVATDPAGDFTIVWGSDRVDVEASRFASDGSFLGQFQISSGYWTSHVAPDVAIAPDGRFAVAWTKDDRRIRAQHFLADVQPLGDMFHANSPVVPFPALDTDANANFVTVWAGEDGSLGGIRAQRFGSSGN